MNFLQNLLHKCKHKTIGVNHGLEKIESRNFSTLFGSFDEKKTVLKTYVVYRCSCGSHKTTTLDGKISKYLLMKTEKEIAAINERIEETNKLLSTRPTTVTEEEK